MNLPVIYSDLSAKEKGKVRDEYIKLQKGKCYFCNLDLKEEPIKELKITKELFPPNFFKYQIHLHHDHESGLTLVVVHNYCNAVLWEYLGE